MTETDRADLVRLISGYFIWSISRHLARYLQAKGLVWYFSGTSLVAFPVLYCNIFATFMVICWYFPDMFPVISWYFSGVFHNFPGTFKVLSGYFLCNFMVRQTVPYLYLCGTFSKFSSFVHTLFIIFHLRFSLFKVTSRYSLGTFPMLS